MKFFKVLLSIALVGIGCAALVVVKEVSELRTEFIATAMHLHHTQWILFRYLKESGNMEATMIELHAFNRQMIDVMEEKSGRRPLTWKYSGIDSFFEKVKERNEEIQEKLDGK
jgi:hypothetical protein